jgi:SAM-dependent methyltransferase
MGAPIGQLTRGTTGYNRLRRSDRWLVHAARVRTALLTASDPLVVDLGYGALPVTTLELASRLRAVRPDIRVVGLEIHPERVRAARASTVGAGVEFSLGGFELAGLRPVLVRAFNVLRQYHVDDVPSAWAQMQSKLAPGGLVVDGTCDELGRHCCWVLLDEFGPLTLTLACDPFAIERPSDLAERLPKVLIHRNVPGEPVHQFLRDLDRAWDHAAPHSVFGPRQRWLAAITALSADWPVLRSRPRGGPGRWRLGEVTLPWAALAPQIPSAGHSMRR